MIRTTLNKIHSSNFQVLECIKIGSIRFNSSSVHQKSEQRKEKDKWDTIYRLPVIGWAAALCKIKLYQAALTTAGIPTSFVAESSNLLPAGSCMVISVLGITGTITLFVASYFTKNLIGLIYINSEKSKLRISYVDFWGKRKNVELHPDQLEAPSEKLQLGFLSEVKTNKESFKLLRRMGIVKDPNIFTYYFGE